MRIGIPRSLLYYKYYQLWKVFFEELGIDIIVSNKTTVDILELGKNIAIDEACLSLKIFLGHVKSLEDKCDYVLVPRLLCIKEKELLCTNFSCLYDLVRNTFPSINILHYNIDLNHNKTEKKAFLNMAKELGVSKIKALEAYNKALKQNNLIKTINQEKQNNKLKSEKIKVLLIGHSYNIRDKFISEDIINFLEKENIEILYGDVIDTDIDHYSKMISSSLYWTYNKELMASLKYYQPKIDGYIIITTFPCGPDSLCNELITRKVNIPHLTLIVDELNNSAGIETRLESFIDILKERRINNEERRKNN